MIYLDSAATSLQKPPAVAQAMARAVSTLASPGRGGHRPSMRAGDVAFRCREAAAQLFHVPDPERVVFTSNATHGLNIAIRTLVRPGDTVVVSGWEHNAVTRPLSAIEDVTIKVAQGTLFCRDETLTAFDRALTPEVGAAVFTHVSNAFGSILPVEEIAQLCHSRGIPFIVDASQSAGVLPVDLEELGADFIAMPGHKGLFGPQGTGLLLCGRVPAPMTMGGTGSLSLEQAMPDFLPDRAEAGTHNMPGIAGLLEGISYVRKKGTVAIQTHETALIRRLGTALEKLQGVEAFLAPDPSAQAGVLSFRVRGQDCEEVAAQLDRRGVAVRAGLHCAPYAHRSAGTLDTGTVRISVSPFTTTREIEQFVAILAQILRRT